MEKARDYFGIQVQSVLSVLVKKGRLTIQLIAKYVNCPQNESSETQTLSTFQIIEALVILIQHGLVSYASSHVRDRLITNYDANQDAIDLLHRYAWYMSAAERLFGNDGLDITRTLLLHGKCNAHVLLSDTHLSETFNRMLTSGYISVVHETVNQTKYDVIEDRVASNVNELLLMKQIPTKSMHQIIILVIKDELIKIREDAISSVTLSSKRKIVHDVDDLDNVKRQKQNADAYHYALNFHKFHVYFKNRDIVHLGLEMFNESAECVLDAFVEKVSSQIFTCKGDVRSIPVNVNVLTPLITNALVVNDDYINPLRNYLEALTLNSPSFLFKDDETNGGSYSLNLKELGRALKLICIQDTIRDVFGSDAVRIWRVLYLKGKLDDKQVCVNSIINVEIANFAMTSQKAARELVYELFKRNYIFMQNVPKSLDYSKCFHLHGVDVVACEQTVLNEFKKSIVNLSMRRRVELQKFKNLQEKLERSDVVADAGLLTDHDNEQIKRMHDLDNTLRIEILRLDKLAMRMSEY